MPDWVGQQLGNYRLIRQLGKGGFGQVYLGEHVYLKTAAAIKLLLEDVGSGTQAEVFQADFLQEARRIAALKHPHILRVLEFGMQGSTSYLVMEYAAHGTLFDRHFRGTRVPIELIVSYTSQIAQALQYAHDARLIHRDVKPANVLLDEQDTILLSDFGIATIIHRTSSMRTSAYAGTAVYMAPEQLQGKPVPASDQYSLAIMVYEWLCGQPPYQGDPIAVGMQHLTAPIPSLRLQNPALSPAIEAVVQRAMAKDPTQRFARVLDFANALEQAYSMSRFSGAPVRPENPYQPQQNEPTAWAAQRPLPTLPSFPPPSFPTTSTQQRGGSKKYTTLVLLVISVVILATGGIYFFNSHKPTSGNSAGPFNNQPSVATPTPTQLLAGSILYQENGSDNWRGWTGSSDWKTSNGQLLDDGTYDMQTVPPTITAPYQVEGTADYAVEAKIALQRQNQGKVGNAFAITVRGGTNSGVWQGYFALLATTGSGVPVPTIYIQNNNPSFAAANLAQAPFNPGTAAHTYRVEVRGNDIKVLIDGSLKVETKDNEFLTGGQVGLLSFDDQLSVTSFSVSAL